MNGFGDSDSTMELSELVSESEEISRISRLGAAAAAELPAMLGVAPGLAMALVEHRFAKVALERSWAYDASGMMLVFVVGVCRNYIRAEALL
jgi:hypothetical protein